MEQWPELQGWLTLGHMVSPDWRKGHWSPRLACHLFSLSPMLFIYQIRTQHLLCTMYTALTKSFPNINSSSQVNLSKKTLDGSYCYYPHLTEEEIKDREMAELAQGYPASQ